MDSATKQYIIFSAVVSFAIAVLVNFWLVNALAGSFAYGFPVSLKDVTGFAEFINRTINTIIWTAVLILPMYWFMLWAYRRANGG